MLTPLAENASQQQGKRQKQERGGDRESKREGQTAYDWEQYTELHGDTCREKTYILTDTQEMQTEAES